jgi:ATP-dependent DNA helicase RecQ
LELIKDTGEKFKAKDLISVIVGKETAVTKSYKLEQTYFGFGKEEKDNYWKTILRQATVQNFLQKDIETYGVLKIAEKGRLD